LYLTYIIIAFCIAVVNTLQANNEFFCIFHKYQLFDLYIHFSKKKPPADFAGGLLSIEFL